MALQMEKTENVSKFQTHVFKRHKSRIYNNNVSLQDRIETFLEENKAMIVDIANARIGRAFNEKEVMSCAAIAACSSKDLQRKWELKLQDTSTFYWYFNKELDNLIGCGEFYETRGSVTTKEDDYDYDRQEEFDTALSMIVGHLNCTLGICADSIRHLKDVRVKKFFEILS